MTSAVLCPTLYQKLNYPKKRHPPVPLTPTGNQNILLSLLDFRFTENFHGKYTYLWLLSKNFHLVPKCWFLIPAELLFCWSPWWYKPWEVTLGHPGPYKFSGWHVLSVHCYSWSWSKSLEIKPMLLPTNWSKVLSKKTRALATQVSEWAKIVWY